MALWQRVVMVVVVLAVVLAGTFSAGHMIRQKRDAAARSRLKAMATAINVDFATIRQEVERLAVYTASLYGEQARQANLAAVDKSKYQLADNGVLYKPLNDGNSAVFVSGKVPVDDAVREIIYFTELLDGKFREIVQKYPEAVQVYYNDKNSGNRIYPFFDVLTQYEPKMDIPSFNFYYLADEKHNPGKKGVWVNEPYVDPAGRGWMVSAIAPVYVNGVLEGVPGIDVTITAITDRYLAQSLVNVMIVDAAGVVVATQDYMANLFSLPPLIEHKYLETIKSDTYHVDYYNLLKNRSREVREMAEKVIKGKQGVAEFQNGKERFLIMAEPIAELDWVILAAVRQ
ncbi:MAG: hypothetical protein HGA80_07545 [Candidatus Omnitrophica bacterium]|nr:hypothetical protein [Candidatus Omnitrophota bacterium]